MENKYLLNLWNAEKVDGTAYFKATMVVALYEFFGTFGLASAMNATSADPYAVPLALFLLIKIAHPITGSHFNPAVSIGVYVNFFDSKIWAHNTIQLSVMIFSQIVGAIIGMEIWRALLEEFDENGVSHFTDAPYLRPTTPAYW